MDLGACPKAHTDRLKTEFEAAKVKDPSNPVFARFQAEYENNIFSFVDECDRRIKAAHRRLEKTPEEMLRRPIWCVGAPEYRVEGEADFCFVRWADEGKLVKSNWLFRVVQRRLSNLVIVALAIRRFLLTVECWTGEQGRVDDSMKELAAVEALKAEKSEKEVGIQVPSSSSAPINPSPERTPAVDRNIWCFRPPEATCMRCMWGLSIRIGFR
jgi:hypothetical protein